MEKFIALILVLLAIGCQSRLLREKNSNNKNHIIEQRLTESKDPPWYDPWSGFDVSDWVCDKPEKIVVFPSGHVAPITSK